MGLEKGHDGSLFAASQKNKTMVNHKDHQGNKSMKLKYVLGGVSEARKCSTSWLSCQHVKGPMLDSC